MRSEPCVMAAPGAETGVSPGYGMSCRNGNFRGEYLAGAKG